MGNLVLMRRQPPAVGEPTPVFPSAGERDMPGVITPQSLDRVLNQEVISRPYTTWDRGISGIIPNRDPTLIYLAPAAQSQYNDERVYDALFRSEHKIVDARRHLENEIFSDEFEVTVGKNNDREAKRLQRFAEQLWIRIPHHRTVLRRLHDSYYYGWSPLQVIVDRQVEFEGRPAWMPSRIVNKPHHMVRLTERGTVAWLPEHHGGNAREFTGADRTLGWMTPAIGDLNHEYGDGGVLSKAFMLCYTKRQIFRRFQTGFDRQYGLVKFQPPDGTKLSDISAEVQAELAASYQYLTANNILIPPLGWAADLMAAGDFLAAGLEVMRWLGDEIMTTFCGETLTSNPGDRGTQALGTVHRTVKTDYAMTAMHESIEDPISGLFKLYIEANYGEQDPLSLPRFVSRLRLRPSVEAVDSMYEMGAGIKARRLADLWGLSSVIAGDDDEDDPDELVLRKAPDGVFGVPGAKGSGVPGNDVDDEAGQKEAKKVTANKESRAAKRQERQFDAMLQQSMEQADGPLRSRARLLAGQFAKANGLDDPS